MKIVINEEELKDVITNHLREQMPDRANENFEVRLVAGRGPEGHYAEIDVARRSDEPTTPTEEETKTPADPEAAVDPFNFGGEDG